MLTSNVVFPIALLETIEVFCTKLKIEIVALRIVFCVFFLWGGGYLLVSLFSFSCILKRESSSSSSAVLQKKKRRPV